MNQLQKIINEIQYRTGATLEDIAKKIDYARPYLNKEIPKGKNVAIRERLIKEYKNELKDFFADPKNSLMLNEDQGEYKNTQLKSEKLQNVTNISLSDPQVVILEALKDIALSNKNISDSNKSVSDANLTLARSNEELVIMLKGKLATNESEKQTVEETVATVRALRELVIDLMAGARKEDPEAARKVFRKAVKDEMKKVDNKDSLVDRHK